jgi:long-subunit acyl-CoA synthetase (AMP-forming)
VVPIYQTNSPDECQYVLENSDASVVVVEDEGQLEKIRKVALDLLTRDLAPDPLRAAAALAYTVGVEDPEVPFRALPPREVQNEAQDACA